MSDPFLFGTVVVGYERTAQGHAALELGELLAASGGARLLAVPSAIRTAERIATR